MPYKDETNQKEMLERLKKANSLSAVAELLEIAPKKLAYILYGFPKKRESHYTEYEIPKKSGGKRKIAVPNKALRSLQCKLNVIFQTAYPERPSAHGFLKNKSIKTNAGSHTKKLNVFNLDLEDFFPSIHFGRVRGMLIAHPYSMHEDAATILAQIVCYKNSIPQGAPSSPIISNMICSKLDGELQRFAKKHRCTYTRYADDITFSTNIKKFPREIATQREGKTFVSNELERIITSNDFKINHKKARLQFPWGRQEVTGLTVNEGVNVNRIYIRNIRSALSHWGKLGIDAASKDYFTKFYPAHKGSGTPEKYRRIIRGRIEHVKFIKGVKKADKKPTVFMALLNHFHTNGLRDFDGPVVRAEGKTDWMHLTTALKALQSKGKFLDLDLNFYRTHDAYFNGDSTMLAFCKQVEKKKLRPYKNLVICVFDRDGIANGEHSRENIRNWGSNVVSLLLPKTGSNDRISIEHLYSDSDLKRTIDGRRLYLLSEFDQTSGRHKSEPHIVYTKSTERKNGDPKIIDSNVLDTRTKQSIALSKNRFASAIKQQKHGFEDVDFDGFEPLFIEIEAAVKQFSAINIP